MIEIVKELIQLLGAASPVLYIFAVSYFFGKILTPILVFSGFFYVVYSIRSCAWWVVRDEVVKRIRKKEIVIDGPDGTDEFKPPGH